MLVLCALVFFAVFLLVAACNQAGSAEGGDETSKCVVDSDCSETEVCVDEICTACKCKELGGVCTPRTESCPEGTFDWSTLDCPGGREEKCCLPTGSCSAVDGICVDWDATCPEGTGAYGSMDCPDGRYDQCCIPVR